MRLNKVPNKLKDMIVKKKVSTLPIFIGDLPSLSDKGLAIRMVEGNPSTTYFGMSNLNYLHNPMVVLVCRVGEYDTGSTLMQSLQEMFDGYHDRNFSGINVIGKPFYLGRTTEKMHEFQLTLSILLKEA